MTQTGYVVFAHGSSIESANEAVREVAARFAKAGGLEMVVAAFLEGGQPSLLHAVDALV
jgi:sirohydrochlorin ferrochelatase